MLHNRLCCIAPVLAAKVLPGCEVTVGHDKEEDGRWPYAGTVGAVQSMGAKHVLKDFGVSFFSVDCPCESKHVHIYRKMKQT